MKQNGMYYITEEYKELVRSLGGEWNDQKKRPVVCLVPSTENDKMYWAIPVGKVNHRDQKEMERIKRFMSYKSRDLRSCYYHIGRTTNRSIFFMTDAVPITDKYILEEHLGADKKLYIIKNPMLLQELSYKLNRILAFENKKENYFRQHITDIKNYLLDELKAENVEESEEIKNNDPKETTEQPQEQ